MGLLSVIRKMKRKEKEMRILMLGLDNAGKTTCVKKFCNQDTSTISPTLGFQISALRFRDYTLNVWDVGGQKSLRSYWRNYFEHTDGLIWVVDSNDAGRLQTCKEELHALLMEERLTGASLLVFLNKQDIPTAMTPDEIAVELDVAELLRGRRHVHLQQCSAATGSGLLEGITWLAEDISRRMYSRPKTAGSAAVRIGQKGDTFASVTEPTPADAKKAELNSAAAQEEIQRLADRLQLMSQDQKTFVDSSTSEIRRNRDEINHLRQENKEMKTTVTSARRGGGNIIENEIRQLDTAIYNTTLRLDKYRDTAVEYEKKVSVQRSTMTEIEKNSKPVITPESEMARKIRMLENRLDKSLIKYNEAVSIRRTYEQIVRRLKEEQVGFDNQLAAIERTLAAKAHDYQELLNMSHQANTAKETAKKELQDFQQAYAAERIAKDEQLAKKKSYVQGRADMTFKLERREKQLKQKEAEVARQQLEEQQAQQAAAQNRAIANTRSNTDTFGDDAARLAQYEAAFRTIKEATGVSDVNELLHKYVSQEETRKHLQQSSHEAQARIDQLKSEIDDLSGKLDELRYSGSGQLGSRRIVEEFEVHLAETQRQTQANGERYEATMKLLISSKAGIEHLADILQGYRPELQPPVVRDDTAVDALKIIEQKLIALVDEVVPTTRRDGSRSLVTAAGTPTDLPAYNLRVRLPRVGDDDAPDDDASDHVDDPADDAVLRREQVKKISVNAIQRETKKLKRRRK